MISSSVKLPDKVLVRTQAMLRFVCAAQLGRQISIMPSTEITKYFESTENRKIREDLVFAVENVIEPKIAIDCGCGAGADINYLVSKGFQCAQLDLNVRHMNGTAQSSVFRRLIMWLVLITLIIVALLYLNSAIYSAWMSAGPPNPYSLGWSRRAIGHLCFALAALSFGLGVFKGIQTFPRATQGAAIFIVLGALLALGPYIGRFVLFDSCLDRGGSWNRGTLQCSDEQQYA